MILSELAMDMLGAWAERAIPGLKEMAQMSKIACVSSVGLVLGLVLAIAAPAALAQPPAAPPGPPAPTAQPDYHPSMADLMTMAVQPRHTKLGLAGKARNWTYLAYEVNEMRGAFNRIARTIPVFDRTTDTAAVIAARFKDPLEMLDAAIKAKDAKRFDAAYGNLTEACNTCHQALNKPFIVIKAPDGTMFGDQDFSGRAH